MSLKSILDAEPVEIVGASRNATPIGSQAVKNLAFRPLPLDEDGTDQMLAEVKSSVILDGVRGKNPVDRKAVCDLLPAAPKIAAAHLQIQDMDFTPAVDINKYLG